MNKIDIRSAVEAVLSLESLGVVTLGAFWNGITLSGDFWRFYCHDQAGAGVIVNGRKFYFAPRRCYLLPPACNLESFCSGSPEQFFIHAEVGCCRPAVGEQIFELPEGFGEDTVSFIRNKVLTGKSQDIPVRMKVLSLMADAVALLPDAALTAAPPDRRIAAVRDYIDTRLNEDISLADMARCSGMSAVAFLRFFKQECGISPYAYLIQRRYNYAAKLLKNSNLPIESICESIGVKDRFHFSRRFKKFSGMAPAAYRKHYK